MTKKQKYALVLVFTLLVVGFLLIDALYLHLLLKPPGLGLDLKGGMNVILTAKGKKGAPVSQEAMEQARFIIEQRVNGLGVSEPVIETQGGRNILVQLPGVKNPQKVLDIIGKTALLEFKPVIDTKGDKLILGDALMSGGIKDARVEFDEYNKPKVGLTFDDKGAKKFDEIAKQLYQKQLAIVLDGKVMSAPTIQATEFRGKAEISGDFSVDETKKLVLVLKTGRLPVELEISENRTVGPTLGRDSLRKGLIAGIVGLILVALFMLVLYRVFGILSWLNLIIFSSLLFGSLAVINASLEAAGQASIGLTLPSVAGIILMIGIAADSSIIVFERIKEQIRAGKTMRVSMEQGYSYGFKTFLHADLVTFITALILFILGIGAVRGFALILMLGIGCDLFTSYLFTRSVLGLLSQYDAIKSYKLMGVRMVEEKA